MTASESRGGSNRQLNRDSLDIVLVEDHADTRKYLQMYLEMSGHRVRAAGSLREALRILRPGGCQVLISDIELPDGNGWELLQRVSDNPPAYAIAMSGFGSTTDRQRSLEAGFQEHFMKPFDLSKLDEFLDRAAGELGEESD